VIMSEEASETRLEALCARLSAFYKRFAREKKNQSKESIRTIAKKYVDKEAKLFNFLRKKYAAEIRAVEAAEIDFESEMFDPVRALQQSGLEIPVKDAPCYDNLSKCRSLLPEEDAYFNDKVTIGELHDPVKEAEKRKLSSSKPFAPVLDVVASCFSNGPMSVLYRSYMNKSNVRIRTRAIDGDRGTIVGKLEAFDKHMNMILRNAEEEFFVKIQGKDILSAIESGERFPRRIDLRNISPKRMYRFPIKRVLRRRILVRGDMVVFIQEFKTKPRR